MPELPNDQSRSRPRCLFGEVQNFHRFFFNGGEYFKLPKNIINKEGIWGNVLDVNCKLWKFENHVEVEQTD